MDFIQWIADVAIATYKHGLNPITLIIAITALLRVSAVKRALYKRLPKRFRHEDKLDSIQRDIRAIKAHMEVPEWVAHSAQVSKSQDVTDGQKISLKPTWETRVRARFIGAFTKLTGRLSRSKTRGESIQMKKFTSRKFILAVTGAILIVLNDGLDLGIDSETVIAFAGLLATWIVGESAVDAKRAGGKNKIDEPGDTGPAV